MLLRTSGGQIIINIDFIFIKIATSTFTSLLQFIQLNVEKEVFEVLFLIVLIDHLSDNVCRKEIAFK
jgi:hypothetical protein